MREFGWIAPADDGLPLAGTLALPDGPGPYPAVLLIFGSGRLDRDAGAGRVRSGIGPALAMALADNGIASLRYDRRGVGDTPGDWLTTGFLDNRADAAAALRSLATHPQIRSGRVAALGHSEGALHALWLAAHTHAAAAVLLAGPLTSGRDALIWQARRQTAALPWPLRRLLPAFGRQAGNQLDRIATSTADALRLGPARINARWYREFMAQDPRTELPRVRVPVLAITGEKDLQVDAAALADVERLVPVGADVRRVSHLTHLLRRDPGKASLLSYPRLLRQPVDPTLTHDIATWLHTRLA
ncbi:alpha/beta fold hydrolase [Micromonospora craniellae]|uniref:Alpha/beta fold hydrolase n=2 Tax=Micromonospora craniellae TaxID=2294034 RepID=A0A372FYE3_9ACTN|nr:alpha/beta fold hydrolase [Micromonospora craniellae]